MRKGRILPAFAFTPPHLVEEVSGTGLLFSDGISRAATTEKVFEQLAQRSDEVLIKIQSIFPFDLFPDYVAIDKNKVTVVNRVFFWLRRSESSTDYLYRGSDSRGKYFFCDFNYLRSKI